MECFEGIERFLFPSSSFFFVRTGASADPGNLFDFFSDLISHAIFARAARQPNYA